MIAISNITRVHHDRIKVIQSVSHSVGPVVYWMSRDQRAEDNWALLAAQDIAVATQQPLIVVFNLVPNFLNAPARPFEFMLSGLSEVEASLASLGIKFTLLIGEPSSTIPQFCQSVRASTLVTDYSPLKISKRWKKQVFSQVKCTVFEVDAHNIIPIWIASQKQEYAARTIRPKIHKLLDTFLTGIPKLKLMHTSLSPNTDWLHARKILKISNSEAKIAWIIPGTEAAIKLYKRFLKYSLAEYDKTRNDPSKSGQSQLSPYLHFGQISAHRIALTIPRSSSFFEELVIRKELAENFCAYNESYDSVEGFPSWARKTLTKHRSDARTYHYTDQQFEQGLTHDMTWNAAQKEMVITGKMHGYMRMYWAKKILEWTESPEEAMHIAIHLNDTYELDGRDPNGYTGIAWAIGGVHDRPWKERPIFGTIRYMNESGLRRKFAIDTYIKRFD